MSNEPNEPAAKRVLPPLSKKQRNFSQLNPDSLTAALHWREMLAAEEKRATDATPDEEEPKKD